MPKGPFDQRFPSVQSLSGPGEEKMSKAWSLILEDFAIHEGATRVSHASNPAPRVKQGVPGACGAQGARAGLWDQDIRCWSVLDSWLCGLGQVI